MFCPQITETLVEKEARAADPSLRPTKETESKINKYIVSYMERLKAAPDYPANIKSAPPKGDKAANGTGSGTSKEGRWRGARGVVFIMMRKILIS
jgi:hypothetical protein